MVKKYIPFGLVMWLLFQVFTSYLALCQEPVPKQTPSKQETSAIMPVKPQSSSDLISKISRRVWGQSTKRTQIKRRQDELKRKVFSNTWWGNE